jgi:hypothetical protein
MRPGQKDGDEELNSKARHRILSLYRCSYLRTAQALLYVVHAIMVILPHRAMVFCTRSARGYASLSRFDKTPQELGQVRGIDNLACHRCGVLQERLSLLVKEPR